MSPPFPGVFLLFLYALLECYTASRKPGQGEVWRLIEGVTRPDSLESKKESVFGLCFNMQSNLSKTDLSSLQ